MKNETECEALNRIRKERLRQHIKCNDCGKFGNALASEEWLGDMGYNPIDICPHCSSKSIAICITKKK